VETIPCTAINIVYVKWVSALFSDCAIHSLAHIPDTVGANIYMH
jgi:hypothetical protein